MKFVSEARIEASVQHVWPILVDVENWPRWAQSFTSLKIVTDGPIGLASQVAIKQPMLAENIWTVCEWNIGRSFAWVSRRIGMLARADHRLQADGRHCVFRQTITFDGPLGRITARLGRDLIADYMGAEAEGLRQIAEAMLTGRSHA